MTGPTENRGALGERGERLAWILGSSRSGSTWLLRMLSQLDPVVPIDDPHLGHHLGVWRPIPLAWATSDAHLELGTISDHKHERRDFFFSDRYREHWMPALRALIEARFGAQVSEDAAERRIAEPMVVVKEPASQTADLLLDLFPASRLVFLLRDGRDVVASWLDAYRSGTWAIQGGAYPVSASGRLGLIRWQSAVWRKRTEVVQAAFAERDPSLRVMIRYEELRRDPTAALERVCATLGTPQEPERLESIATANSYESVPFRDKGQGREIRRAQPGSWRQSMTTEEIAAMHEILGPKLAELGYPDPYGRDLVRAA